MLANHVGKEKKNQPCRGPGAASASRPPPTISAREAPAWVRDIDLPAQRSNMSIVTPNKNKYKPSNHRVIDWSALRQELPGQYGVPRGSCESCKIFLWSDGALRVPGLRGIYCSILCVECELFRSGRCRWCAAPLGSTAKKFCDAHCHRQSQLVRFGDGTRLLKFLSHRHPRLYEELVGKRGHACLNCDHSLEEKPSDARFCSDRCRKKFHRCTMSGKSQKSGLYPDTGIAESITCETPKTGPVPNIVQPPKAVEIAGVSV